MLVPNVSDSIKQDLGGTKLNRKTAILLISSPDQKGLVASVSTFLFTYHANILHADQHLDFESHLFLMRVEWDLEGFSLSREEFAVAFFNVAQKHTLNWQLSYSESKCRLAILVSKYDHCLVDLLYRQQTGDIHCEIPLIISNHSDAQKAAAFYQVDFHRISPQDGHPNECKEDPLRGKLRAETRQLQLLKEYKIDLIVLARYMQILTPDFVSQFPNRIINIHHSFLPAFLGAKPYHRAFERGVKLIGATSHYVTQTLDDGPIIEQDVVRISHRDEVDDLVQKGRDLEKWVLSRAVRWHLENRILVYGNKTVVFD